MKYHRYEIYEELFKREKARREGELMHLSREELLEMLKQPEEATRLYTTPSELKMKVGATLYLRAPPSEYHIRRQCKVARFSAFFPPDPQERGSRVRCQHVHIFGFFFHFSILQATAKRGSNACSGDTSEDQAGMFICAIPSESPPSPTESRLKRLSQLSTRMYLSTSIPASTACVRAYSSICSGVSSTVVSMGAVARVGKANRNTANSREYRIG